MVDTAVDVPIVSDDSKSTDVIIDDKGGKTETKIVTADEGIEDLKAQVARSQADSARRLQEAERRIAEAFKEATAAKQETATVKRDQVGTIIEKLAADKDAARRDLIAAKEAGDFAKEADALDRLSMANTRIVEAEKGKMALEEEASRPQGRQIAQEDPVSDPVEAVARSMGTQRSANWVRQHPEQVINGRISDAALEGHNQAVGLGYAPDSDTYFQHIETVIGAARRPEPRQDRQQAQQGRDMNRAPTSAPVNRDVMQAPGAQRPGSIRLEAHEVQTAIDTYSPLYPKESRDQLLKRYAQDKMALMDEGKISRRAS